jgi:titin
VKATAGKGKATVTWKAPVVTNGRITAYTVTPMLGKVAGKAVTFPGTALKGVISGLQKGKAYTFTIVAKNAKGVSLASKPSNIVKPT